jgi:ribosomal protein S18 acetylase RimI-like enzyme
MVINFRRATPDDAPELAKVHVASLNKAYRGVVPDSHFRDFTIETRTERFRESLATRSEETYVAEQDGDVLGFLTLGEYRDPDVSRESTGEIWGIYLAPQYWRKGIGRLLSQKAETILASRGHSEATLWVLERNDQARQFYEAMGFRTDGATKEVNLGALIPAVRYRKKLKDA